MVMADAFLEKLSDDEREVYCKIQDRRRKNNDNKAVLLSPFNDMIYFNPFQYRPYIKLQSQARGKTRKVYIADEVGAGKTIEVGIILTELIYKKELDLSKDRCMIICPNLLCRKWRNTLKSLFGIDASIIYSISEVNIGINILSFDTVSNADEKKIQEALQREQNKQGKVKVLIVDEAHNASGDRFAKMQRIREEVDEKGGYVVLLSATPFSGARGEEAIQVQLLTNGEENVISVENFFMEENTFLTRNRKQDMRYAQSGECIVNTHIKNHYIENNELVEYMQQCEALFSGAITILKFQGLNMLMSSPVAGLKYLNNLLEKTNEDLLDYLIVSQQRKNDDSEDEDYEDEECEDEGNSVECSLETVELIRSGMEKIREKVKEMVSHPEQDKKLQKLVKIIEENKEKFISGDERQKFYNHIIVFTDKVSTAKYLEENLKKKYKTFRVTGEMFEIEKRQRLQQYENETEDMSILIITNVACEGQDMDYGNTIINYDLDYNPVRLEQRRGRVDRFEVKKNDIYIHNFMVKDFDMVIGDNTKQYNQYSKVAKISNKITEIQETTGVFYEIFESSKEASILQESREKVKGVYRELWQLIKPGESADIEKLEEWLEKDGLKKLYTQIEQELLKEQGVNTKYELISRKLQDKGITVEEKEGKICITTDKKNQDFLKYVYFGGTLVSHLMNE